MLCNIRTRVKHYKEKVNFRSQILECRPSIGQYWNIFGVPVLPENVILTFFRTCYCIIQKLTILEHKNGLVLSNTRVPVSGTWSILFPIISNSMALTVLKPSYKSELLNNISNSNAALLFRKCGKSLKKILRYSKGRLHPMLSINQSIINKSVISK